MNFNPRKQAEIALIAIATLAVPIMIFGSIRMGLEPFWLLAAVSSIALALFLMRKWPIAIFVGFQFVGNFKTVPAQGFQLTDPTMILLLLCVGAVVIQILFAFAALDDYNLASRFRGQSRVSLLFLMLLASLTISTLYTPAVQHGTMKTLRFFVFESLSFFYPVLFIKDRKDVRQLIRWFVILGLALSVKVLLGLLHPSESVMQGDTDITQIGDGMLLGIALIMVIVGGELTGALKYLILGALSFALVTCAARSPLVTFLFTIAVTAIYAKGHIAKVSRKAISASGIFALFVIVPTLMWVQNLPVAQARLEWKQEELESALSGSLLQRGTVALREDFYHSAIQAFIEHPIGGVGTGGWPVFYNNADVPHYPHNFVLEVAAEQGVIGLGILLSLLALLFKAARHVLRSNAYLAFVFPVFVFGIVLNLMTGDIESRPLWFCCGLVAAASRFSAQCGDAIPAHSDCDGRGNLVLQNLYPASVPIGDELSGSSGVVA